MLSDTLSPELARPVRTPVPFGPHWFAIVMGTAMVALCTAALPWAVPGRSTLSTALWLASLGLLVLLTVRALGSRQGRPGLTRVHLLDPQLGHFYGAPGIALLTCGAATVTIGPDLLGSANAVALSAALWCVGTASALTAAVVVPLTAIHRHRYDEADHHHTAAVGVWLLPVVGPLVAANGAALLAPHLGDGELARTALLGAYGLGGASVLACLVTFAHLWSQLLHDGPGPAAAVPLLWIPLGFLGQSVTVFAHLSDAAPRLDSELAPTLRAFALAYGLPVWGSALGWLALVVALTVRAQRQGLSFSMRWWSFTFPLGTVAMASVALGDLTDLALFDVVAGTLTAALLVIWVVVMAGTLKLLTDLPRTRPTRAG